MPTLNEVLFALGVIVALRGLWMIFHRRNTTSAPSVSEEPKATGKTSPQLYDETVEIGEKVNDGEADWEAYFRSEDAYWRQKRKESGAGGQGGGEN